MSPLVFITGASSGLGQALAARYAALGWRLALVGRRAGAMADWARAQGLPASQWAVYPADVSQVDTLARAAQDCLEAQGLPQVVIANAGISLGVDTRLREDIEVMARTLAVNTVGVAATFQPFIGPMQARGQGRLVGIASVAGARGLPGHGAYCASKAAVISYCESLRGELHGSGVRVVTISPGYVATPLTARNRYPMPFLLAPDEFAARAVRAIERGSSHPHIPWQMGWVARVLRVLPDPVFDRLLVGRPRKHRHDES